MGPRSLTQATPRFEYPFTRHTLSISFAQDLCARGPNSPIAQSDRSDEPLVVRLPPTLAPYPSLAYSPSLLFECCVAFLSPRAWKVRPRFNVVNQAWPQITSHAVAHSVAHKEGTWAVVTKPRYGALMAIGASFRADARSAQSNMALERADSVSHRTGPSSGAERTPKAYSTRKAPSCKLVECPHPPLLLALKQPSWLLRPR